MLQTEKEKCRIIYAAQFLQIIADIIIQQALINYHNVWFHIMCMTGVSNCVLGRTIRVYKYIRVICRGYNKVERYSENKFSGANGDREKFIFAVQMATTSRIGNLTRLILTLAKCNDHIYIQT